MEDLEDLLNGISFHTLKHFNIRVTNDMINKQKITNTWIIYLSFLKSLDIPVESVYMIQASQRMCTQVIGHYEDAIPQINIYLIIKKIMQSSGLIDFQFDDFIRPTKDRFIIVMRKILEILDKKESFYHDFQNKLVKIEDDAFEAEKLEAMLKSYIAVYSEKKSEKSKCDLAIKKFNEELDALKNENLNFTNDKDEEKKKIGEVKKELIETQTNLTELLNKNNEISEEIKVKKAKIITSPDEFKNEVLKNEMALQSLEREHEAELAYIRQMEETIKKHQHNLKSYERIISQMQSLDVHHCKKEELCNQLESIVFLNEDIDKRKKIIKSDYQFTKQENIRYTENIKNLKVFQNSMNTERKKKLSDIKNNEFILKNSIDSLKKLIQDETKSYQNVKEEINDAETKCNQYINKLDKENFDVSNEIIGYIERFSVIEDKIYSQSR